METDLPINHRILIPGAELIVTASRSSGPGGQNVNKTSSRISLRWNIKETKALTEEEKLRVLHKLNHRIVGDGDILINVETERSQLQNRRIARERLAQLITEALIHKKTRRKTKPTAGSKARRVETKKLRGIVKKLRKQNGED